MYTIYKKDPDNFTLDYLRKMNAARRGNGKSSIYAAFLLLAFDVLFKEEKE